MATKIAATGVKFQLTTDAGMSWDDLGSIRSLSGPGYTVDVADVTTHDSEDAFEEVVPTIVRTGEVQLELVWDPADTEHEELFSRLESRTKETYRIVWPDAANTTYEFEAYVVGYEPEAPHDDALVATVTMKLTGKPDRAAS